MALAASTSTGTHSKPVNIRIREDVRALIDRAAKSQGKSRSDFMVDAARRAAEEAMLDQTLFTVSAADHDRFIAILDQPPEPTGFARLMEARRPWEA
jgi:uncharacterized protein (DUF1778 family)